MEKNKEINKVIYLVTFLLHACSGKKWLDDWRRTKKKKEKEKKETEECMKNWKLNRQSITKTRWEMGSDFWILSHFNL